MPPRCIGVAVPLALGASLHDVALTVPPRGKVGGVYRYVTPKIRQLSPEGFGASVDALRERGMVLAELGREAVAGPYARRRAESVLQAGMLRDQGGYPRPRRESEQPLDETGTYECVSAEALASPLVAYRFNCGDQGGYFGGVENGGYLRDSRTTRYFARCHWRSLSCGQALGSANCAGANFFGFAGQILTRASDDTAAGGPRICAAAACLFTRSEDVETRPCSGGGTRPADDGLLSKELGCGRRDSNPQSPGRAGGSKPPVYSSSTTPAPKLSKTRPLGCHNGAWNADAQEGVTAESYGRGWPLETCDQIAQLLVAVLLASAEKMPTERGRFNLNVSARRAPDQADDCGEHEDSEDDQDHQSNHGRSLLLSRPTINRSYAP
jgi:hypothetical protein